jgi:Fe2+ or Zn2+ uptake regulation protein
MEKEVRPNWFRQMTSIMFCHHEWKTHNSIRYENMTPSNTDVLICINCGKIKRVSY